MGCKSSKILHDEPCTCQHRKHIKHDIKHDDIVVVRSPSPASSFYNSNTSTYSSESSESAYSNGNESTSRQPFLQHQQPTMCDHPSHYSNSNSTYSDQPSFFESSRPRMRKETIGKSYKNKPLPRRNRSGREMKVLVPKSSLSQHRRRRSIEAIEANRDRERDREREPEEPGPWAMTEHNKLVPILQPVNRVKNVNNVNYAGNVNNAGIGVGSVTGTVTGTGTSRAVFNEQTNVANVNGNGLSLRKNRLPTPKREGTTSDYIVTGGYVVSPEMYYASLPLPDLPPPRHSEPAPVTGANQAKRNEVIHQQMKQNAEIVQARRAKDVTGVTGVFGATGVTGTKIPNRNRF